MSYLRERFVLRSMRAKVLLAFVLTLLALALSWVVVHVALKEMMSTVDELSRPNRKLIVSNEIFKRVSQMDQRQKAKALQNPTLPFESFLKGSQRLRLRLDTLNSLMDGNAVQSKRIDTMYSILDERDRLFVEYLELRTDLVSNKSLSRYIKSLSQLIASRTGKIDSSIVTTQKKITTTMVVSSDTLAEKERSFFARLFKPKKEEKEEVVKTVIEEDLDIQIDTVARYRQDSVIRQAEELMNELRKDQHIRSIRLVNRELELLNASNALISKLLKVLHDFEEEEIRRAEQNKKETTLVLRRELSRFNILVFSFFLLVAFLVFLILSDISKSGQYRLQLLDAKEEAEQLSQVKERFLANMSHEIRTPLQSIIGFAEQLVHKKQHGDERAVDAIFHSAHHLLHIVNEVLDYSRITLGKFMLDNEAFLMGQVLTEVTESIQMQADKKGILFNCDIAFEDIRQNYYEGDPFRLKQILFNLLGNAVKFTNEGQVSFTVERKPGGSGDDFVFHIRDTGIGIPQHEQRRIFQQFEQVVDSSSSRRGAGLGLSIVQALVQAKGGQITLESKPAKGTSFQVKLHYSCSEKPQAVTTTVDDLANMSAGTRIVMVDDDRLIRELCSVVLARYGIALECYPSAEAFLATTWQDAAPAIFLVDIRLPGISGAALAKQIREVLGDKVRLIAVTAQVMKKDRDAILNDGFDELLVKPFVEKDLVRMLRGIIPEQQSQEPVWPVSPDIPDLTNLRKMVSGDEDLIRSLIREFISDSREDVHALRQDLERNDHRSVAEWIHRLAGRCGQLGAFDLAALLRKLEVDVREHQISPVELSEHVHSLMVRLDALFLYLSDDVPEKV